jgi:hypothetical protein
MKKNLVYIFLAIAIVITFVYFYLFNKLGTRSNSAQNIQRNYTVTGILRELVLDEEQIKQTQLNDGKFILLQINSQDKKKLPNGTERLYIENYDKNINSLVGKCVTVKGVLDDSWLEKTKDMRSNKVENVSKDLPIIPNSMETVDYKTCEGYLDISQKTEGTKRLLSGILERIPRDDPDMEQFDYVMRQVPEGEYANYNYDTKTGSEMKFDDIAVIPTNNETWQTLEKNVRRIIIIEGYEKETKGKTKYLTITRVME